MNISSAIFSILNHVHSDGACYLGEVSWNYYIYSCSHPKLARCEHICAWWYYHIWFVWTRFRNLLASGENIHRKM